VNASAADLRTGGKWTLRQRVKNDGIFVVATFALAIASRLPSSVTRALGRALGAIAWAILPSLRRLAVANVARGLPGVEPTRLVRRCYRSLGTILGETVATLDPRREPALLPFLPGSLDILLAAHAEGRGVVFASGHLGPWERVAATVATRVPLTVVAREPYDPRLAAIYARLRADRGIRAVYRGASGAGIALVRVLRRGGVLAIPMDLSTRAASIDVPFLDVTAPTAVGPARLAIRTGAPVVVGTVAPTEDGALGISFVRIEEASCERELTTRINEELSSRIRALPELWPWMHQRWPADC
jgi:Kdo2-lipid IVA lauroyltransferase/acyltransferase